MKAVGLDLLKVSVIVTKVVIILYFMNSKLTFFAYQNF